MSARKAYVLPVVVGGLVGLVFVAALAAFTWGGGSSGASATPAASEEPTGPPVCKRAERVHWQKLANEVRAPVYCPSWLPIPLEGKFSGPYFNGRSVDKDRSYLVSFVWFESASQGAPVMEVHVNLRAYPGRTRIPKCEDTLTVSGKTVRKDIPCFSDRQRQKKVGPLTVTVYTANQGADMWHVLYAWRRNGTLYTLSEHVAPPYTYQEVISHLDYMTRRLVLIEPAT